ncbi:MAG TPA: tRNA pseudouridine(38-40) synthase TruA [Chlamydiales bacterium]|nr:tRNA pseudouridine(38-40) synthase TruA [Chlamydiales bacterium]
MESNYKCLLAYDGTRYLGWQKTKEGPSIEEELEKALQEILQEEILLQAASRTDRGVHAKGQVVNFRTSKKVDVKKLLKGVNALLPNDIALLSIEKAYPTFHPTLDAKGKEYHYEIFTGKVLLPQKRHFVWHYPYPLALEKMLEAKETFIGQKEYQSFCNIRTEDGSREIYSIDIEEREKDHFHFIIKGRSFLYKMARTIVGSLVYVGRGKIEVDSLPLIFTAKDRRLAGITAPAHGLTLMNVFYLLE